MGNKETAMTFKAAVENTPDIKTGFCKGLQALGGNARLIATSDSRMLSGSVDIDQCTKDLYPTAPRWDYAIGYNDSVYFFEIHPASTSNVREVIKKAEWLKEWLDKKAPALKALAANNVYYWIASGKHGILHNSPQYRQLSQSKVKLISNCRLPL